MIRKILGSMGSKIYSSSFFQLNDDEHVWIEIKHVLHCILCHSIALGAHVLGLKTQGRKGLISYKTKSGTATMKKHCETKHSNILNVYTSEIV
jgi:hypothetical protein